MDSQRCIHDMVMRFQFVRHFYLKKQATHDSGFVLFSTGQVYSFCCHFTSSCRNVCDGLAEQKSLNVDQPEKCAHLSKQSSSQQQESIVAVLYYFQCVVCEVKMLLFSPMHKAFKAL